MHQPNVRVHGSVESYRSPYVWSTSPLLPAECGRVAQDLTPYGIVYGALSRRPMTRRTHYATTRYPRMFRLTTEERDGESSQTWQPHCQSSSRRGNSPLRANQHPVGVLQRYTRSTVQLRGDTYLSTTPQPTTAVGSHAGTGASLSYRSPVADT
jgi:hypothetical protein